MAGTVTAAAIGVISVLLLGYWFRYTCLVMLASRATPDRAREVTATKRFSFHELKSMMRERTIADLGRFCAVAVANQISFPEVQSLLREQAVTDLDRLRDSLDHDYGIVSRLFPGVGEARIKAACERHMLAINYHLLGVWYCVRRRFSSRAARHILEEMSWIVAYFADTTGQFGTSAT